VGENSATDRPIAADKGATASVGLILGGPQRFAGPARRLRRRDPAVHQGVVHSDDVNVGGEGRVLQNRIYDGPLTSALARIFIATNDSSRRMTSLELSGQLLNVGGVIFLFVPDSCVLSVQVVIPLRRFNKARDAA